jgi:solute:Na+ symporter, SSS family
MGGAMIIITILAFNVTSDFSIAALKNPDWSSILPSWKLWDGYQTTSPSSYQQFDAFGPLLLAGICFGAFKMLAGPLTWDFNFFLSTKNARQASLAAGVWTFAHIIRWFIILSFVILGAYYLGNQAGFDGEKIMPMVLTKLPIGLTGLFVAILLSALMSTISAIINITSNVIINDVLKRYFIKSYPEKKLVRIGMVVSIIVMISAYLLSFLYQYIVSAWEFIQYALLMMIHVPASLRWHWWRFGAKAYVWSMIASFGVVVIQQTFFSDVPQYTQLFMVVGFSLAFTLIITLITKPTHKDILIKFYSNIRPFGFWKPVRLEAIRLGLVPAKDKMPRMDMINTVLSIVFQLSIGIMPFYFLLKKWDNAMIWAGVCISSAIALYFTWYKNLPADEE